MDKKELELIRSFAKLKADAMRIGLSCSEVENLLLSDCSEAAKEQRRKTVSSRESSGGGATPTRSPRNTRLLLSCVTCIAIAVLYLKLDSFQQMPCLMETNPLLMEVARPIESCSMCEGLETFPIYRDISQEEFLEKHAYTGRPALILTGATSNWTAMETFSFRFFQELYQKTPGAFESQEDCQFFPYNTDFETLQEFFNMSDSRANLKEDQWYIGWSNCDSTVATQLRRHYSLPHFLPEGAESSSLDWIFMGGPGLGANIHVDNVDRPSWQAQIRGKKTWTLIPPPECEDVCHNLEATMSQGNVIVVDTNKWYHKTDIHPGDISITIGSEYD